MSKRNVDWKRVEHRLGEEPDTEIAESVGVTRTAVCLHRQKHGIPRYSATERGLEDYGHLMGTMPDSALANIMGVSQATVTVHRNRAGIGSWKGPSVDLQLYASLLGVLSDAEIAEAFGISRRIVCTRRNQLGIQHVPNPRKIDWEPYDCLLGVLPDPAVAAIMGCTQPAVTVRRRKLGKPSFTQNMKLARSDMIDDLRSQGTNLVTDAPDDDVYRNALQAQSLRDTYDWISRSPDPLNLLHAIYLVDTRTNDLLSRLDSGESGRVWADLRKVQAQLKIAVAKGDAKRAASLLVQMDSLIEAGYGDYETWREVSAMLDQRLRLTKAEWRRRVDMRQMVSIEQLMHLVFTLVGIIREQITDEAVLETIEARFSEVVSTPLSNLDEADV